MRHVYVHVPFCARRCSYCDFAIAVRRVVPVDAFLQALATEMERRPPDPQGIETLYLGGGTPSRLGGDGIARLIALLRSHAPLLAGSEVTLEANPEDVTPEFAAAWRAAGVTRISLGAQSFHDHVLSWMHRVHDAERTRLAMEILRGAGFDNISLDLIFAIPEGVERSWTRELEELLALAPQHASLYGLTVEPATPLARWRDRGEATEAPEERYASEFLLAHDRLTAAGFEHYEVSNYALPGFRSRHNAMYWRRVPYRGYGPGAHEFAPPVRRWNARGYAEWERRMRTAGDATDGTEVLGDCAEIAEQVYLALRTTGGLTISRDELSRVQPWIDAGWARVEGDRLFLTANGWLRLDRLASDLTAFRSC